MSINNYFTISKKGLPCHIKPILCQEGYCQDCQIYLDSQGRTVHGSITPEWLREYEKEQADKIASLQRAIAYKRLDAFNEACCGSREHQLQAQAMVNAYDVCLKLIDKMGGKG